jgi:hypothetical protein
MVSTTAVTAAAVAVVTTVMTGAMATAIVIGCASPATLI